MGVESLMVEVKHRVDDGGHQVAARTFSHIPLPLIRAREVLQNSFSGRASPPTPSYAWCYVRQGADVVSAEWSQYELQPAFLGDHTSKPFIRFRYLRGFVPPIALFLYARAKPYASRWVLILDERRQQVTRHGAGI